MVIQVLVDSPTSNTSTYLRRELEVLDYQFKCVDVYSPFNEIALQVRPQIVIFDQIHKRQALVGLRIKLLKELCPDVRIIAISQEPSSQDAEVVELGVFYYLCGCNRLELIRVIRAAADSFIGRCNARTSSEIRS